MNNTPICIIDTDPGHDDALALLLMLKSQRFNIQAITTVAGNATIANVTRNAQALLNALGSEVSVYSGVPNPLVRLLVTAVVHGETGMAGFDTSNTTFTLTGNAAEKIVELVRANPGEVTILALGPLSNIARAFLLDPELPSLVKQVVMMGGAINVPGNKNRVAEFNFFVDPEAANIVFQSSVPKVLVPLDLCNQVVLQLSEFQALMDPTLKPILTPMMEHFFAGLTKDEGTSGILVYDTLAAFFLLSPEACTLTEMNIVIETQGEHTFGMSVAERRSYKKLPPNTSVVTAIDDPHFRSEFFKILNT